MILPAIIAKDQQELDNRLSMLEGKLSDVMLDFMDGKFVHQRSLDFDAVLSSIFNYEAHLMVREPLKYINSLSDEVHRISSM